MKYILNPRLFFGIFLMMGASVIGQSDLKKIAGNALFSAPRNNAGLFTVLFGSYQLALPFVHVFLAHRLGDDSKVSRGYDGFSISMATDIAANFFMMQALPAAMRQVTSSDLTGSDVFYQKATFYGLTFLGQYARHWLYQQAFDEKIRTDLEKGKTFHGVNSVLYSAFGKASVKDIKSDFDRKVRTQNLPRPGLSEAFSYSLKTVLIPWAVSGTLSFFADHLKNINEDAKKRETSTAVKTKTQENQKFKEDLEKKIEIAQGTLKNMLKESKSELEGTLTASREGIKKAYLKHLKEDFEQYQALKEKIKTLKKEMEDTKELLEKAHRESDSLAAPKYSASDVEKNLLFGKQSRNEKKIEELEKTLKEKKEEMSRIEQQKKKIKSIFKDQHPSIEFEDNLAFKRDKIEKINQSIEGFLKNSQKNGFNIEEDDEGLKSFLNDKGSAFRQAIQALQEKIKKIEKLQEYLEKLKDIAEILEFKEEEEEIGKPDEENLKQQENVPDEVKKERAKKAEEETKKTLEKIKLIVIKKDEIDKLKIFQKNFKKLKDDEKYNNKLSEARSELRILVESLEKSIQEIDEQKVKVKK